MPTSSNDIGEVEKVHEDIEELIKLTEGYCDWNAIIGEGQLEKKLLIITDQEKGMKVVTDYCSFVDNIG